MEARGFAKRMTQAVVRKAADLFFPHAWGTSMLMVPGRSTYDYAGDIGHGLGSSALMAPIQWLMRAWPEARLVVRQHKRGQADPSVVDNHPLPALVHRPNEFYSGEALWMATAWSWCIDGNAYWRVVRTRGGAPQELWWVPFWQIKPVRLPDSRQFISHYEYTPAGKMIPLSIDQVVHFRHGINPYNTMLGVSPISSVLREVWTDDESTNWVAAILRNSGVPGLIITPKGEGIISVDEAEQVKSHIESRFTGDQRGRPMVLGGPSEVHKLSFAPNEMDMSVVHNTAEERVAAVLGIPAAVVGFGSGMDQTKVGATMSELVGLAWSNGLIPPQRIMAGELQRTLLAAFEQNTDRFEVGWDYSSVAALQEDEGTKLQRFDMGVKGGWIKVSEARAAMGLQTTPEDEIYLRPMSVTPVDPDDQMPEPLPATTPLRMLPEGENLDGDEAEDETEDEAEEASVSEELELKQGTLPEFINQLIGRHAGRLDPIPRPLLRLASRLWREEQARQPAFQAQVLTVLQRYGTLAGTAAREVLAPKQSLQDLMSTSVILERIPLVSIKADLEQVYLRLYDEMLRLTAEVLTEALDVELTDPGRIQTHLHTLARERVALVDLSKSSRVAILRSLEEARTQGMSEDAMLDLIRERVPAGRWLSAETRARILVRSESRFAANIATAQYAQQIGANRVLVLDARLGPTDLDCETRNSWIVSPAEAQLLAGIEHANGTLALLPLPTAMAPSGKGL